MIKRQVSFIDWGTEVIEDILFMAAKGLSEMTDDCRFVEVSVPFRITANANEETLEISSPRATGVTLVTTLPRPF